MALLGACRPPGGVGGLQQRPAAAQERSCGRRGWPSAFRLLFLGVEGYGKVSSRFTPRLHSGKYPAAVWRGCRPEAGRLAGGRVRVVQQELTPEGSAGRGEGIIKIIAGDSTVWALGLWSVQRWNVRAWVSGLNSGAVSASQSL